MEKRKKIKKKAFESGSRVLDFSTLTGKNFKIYQKRSKFSRAKSFTLGKGDIGKYFDSHLKPEFRKFYKTHRAKGRIHFSFSAKMNSMFNPKNKRTSEYISSTREELITDEDFDSLMERFREEFIRFAEQYLTKKIARSIIFYGVGMEVMIRPNEKPRKRKTKKKPAKTKRGKRKPRKSVKRKKTDKRRKTRARKPQKTKRSKKHTKTVRRGRHRK